MKAGTESTRLASGSVVMWAHKRAGSARLLAIVFEQGAGCRRKNHPVCAFRGTVAAVASVYHPNKRALGRHSNRARSRPTIP